MKNIIAIDIKDNTLTDSLGRSVTANPEKPEELLEFLMIKEPNSFIVCWNLYALLSVLRSVMPESIYNTLLESDKVWFSHYKIFSNSGKKLSIGHEYKTHVSGNFYNSDKVEVDIYNLYTRYPSYQPTDVQDIYAKGIEYLQALEAMGLQEATTLASDIAAFSGSILSKYFIPHLYACPDEALDMSEYALGMINREWRAVYKVGYWQEAYHTDMSGAYPSIVKDFGDLSRATYWYSKKYEPCDFGIFKGYVTIDANISPIININNQPVNGKRYTDFMTTEQWGFLNHYHIGKFEPIGGWMIKYQNDYKPFQKIMTDLYANRENGGLQSDISKSISNGLIGKFGEYYEEKKGDFYNPMYSVMATSRASLKVGKMIYENNLQDNLINVVVDGFLTDKDTGLGNKRSLGNFRTEQVKALVLSLGHTYMGDKHPDNHTLEDMLLAIESKPEGLSYNRVILNKDLNTTNREWNNGYPESGNDWLTKTFVSSPIEV